MSLLPQSPVLYTVGRWENLSLANDTVGDMPPPYKLEFLRSQTYVKNLSRRLRLPRA